MPDTRGIGRQQWTTWPEAKQRASDLLDFIKHNTLWPHTPNYEPITWDPNTPSIYARRENLIPQSPEDMTQMMLGLIQGGYTHQGLAPTMENAIETGGSRLWRQWPEQTVEGPLIMHSGMWDEAMQSFLPSDTAQELRVFELPKEKLAQTGGKIPREAYRQGTVHFKSPSGEETAVGHARAVPFGETMPGRTGKPEMRLWEEVQQELEKEKGWLPIPERPSSSDRWSGGEGGWPRVYGYNTSDVVPDPRYNPGWFPDSEPYTDTFQDFLDEARGSNYSDLSRSWSSHEGPPDIAPRAMELYDQLPESFRNLVDTITNATRNYPPAAQDQTVMQRINPAIRWAYDYVAPWGVRGGRHIGGVLRAVESSRGGSGERRISGLIENLYNLDQALRRTPPVSPPAATPQPTLMKELGQKYVNINMIKMLMEEAHSKGEPFMMADIPTVFARGGGSINRLTEQIAPGILNAYENLPKSLGLKRDILEFVTPVSEASSHSRGFDRIEAMMRGSSRAEQTPAYGLSVERETIQTTTGPKDAWRVRLPVWIDERSVGMLKKAGKWTPEGSEWAGNKLPDLIQELRDYQGWMDKFAPHTRARQVDDLMRQFEALYSEGSSYSHGLTDVNSKWRPLIDALKTGDVQMKLDPGELRALMESKMPFSAKRLRGERKYYRDLTKGKTTGELREMRQSGEIPGRAPSGKRYRRELDKSGEEIRREMREYPGHMLRRLLRMEKDRIRQKLSMEE